MSDKQETIADIVNAMRDEYARRGGSFHGGDAIDWLRYADRIEAAYKREVEKLNSVIQATVSRSDAEIDRLRREAEELRKQIGNAAALREALEDALRTIRGVINGTISPRSNTVFDCRDKLSAALAAPPRNCDVGTAEEQEKRFRRVAQGESLKDAVY